MNPKIRRTNNDKIHNIYCRIFDYALYWNADRKEIQEKEKIIINPVSF